MKKIGEGTEGDVYLYQDYKGNKVVAKILKTDRAKQPINKDSYYLRTLHRQFKMKYIPKYIGSEVMSKSDILLMEHIDYSVEEYLELPQFAGKLSTC